MSSENRYRLSKSKIAAFEHCPKRLWLQIHHRAAAEHDTATLARFQFGHDVGERARSLVPGGILIDDEPDMQAAVARTAELLALPEAVPLFEATFQYEDVLVRVDILIPDGRGEWRAVEVKASSRVRGYQLADLATQVWVMRNCGVSITSAAIRHLVGPVNWTRPDVGSVRFADTDVSGRLHRLLADRAAVVNAARHSIRRNQPLIEMGSHCTTPFACEFQASCRRQAAVPLLHQLPMSTPPDQTSTLATGGFGSAEAAPSM